MAGELILPLEPNKILDTKWLASLMMRHPHIKDVIDRGCGRTQELAADKEGRMVAELLDLSDRLNEQRAAAKVFDRALNGLEADLREAGLEATPEPVTGSGRSSWDRIQPEEETDLGSYGELIYTWPLRVDD